MLLGSSRQDYFLFKSQPQTSLKLIRRISSSIFLWDTFLKKKKRMEIFKQVKKGNEGYIVRQHYPLKMYNSCIIQCLSSGRGADIFLIGFKLCAISQVSVIYFCSRFYSSQISVFNEKKKKSVPLDNGKIIKEQNKVAETLIAFFTGFGANSANHTSTADIDLSFTHSCWFHAVASEIKPDRGIWVFERIEA